MDTSRPWDRGRAGTEKKAWAGTLKGGTARKPHKTSFPNVRRDNQQNRKKEQEKRKGSGQVTAKIEPVAKRGRGAQGNAEETRKMGALPEPTGKG